MMAPHYKVLDALTLETAAINDRARLKRRRNMCTTIPHHPRRQSPSSVPALGQPHPVVANCKQMNSRAINFIHPCLSWCLTVQIISAFVDLFAIKPWLTIIIIIIRGKETFMVLFREGDSRLYSLQVAIDDPTVDFRLILYSFHIPWNAEVESVVVRITSYTCSYLTLIFAV